MAKPQQEGRGVHPYLLTNARLHPLARMLPLLRPQLQVYRLAEKLPPGLGPGFGPTWEVINAVLAARGTSQLRVHVQRAFTLLAVLSSSSSNVNGGYRAQFFDLLKQRRFADRGVNFATLAGGPSGGFRLREPYSFDLPDSQILVTLQNLETVQNTVQVVLFGMALRFNDAGYFPGGNVVNR
jgi:hypothetical protein